MKIPASSIIGKNLTKPKDSVPSTYQYKYRKKNHIFFYRRRLFAVLIVRSSKKGIKLKKRHDGCPRYALVFFVCSIGVEFDDAIWLDTCDTMYGRRRALSKRRRKMWLRSFEAVFLLPIFLLQNVGWCLPRLFTYFRLILLILKKNKIK